LFFVSESASCHTAGVILSGKREKRLKDGQKSGSLDCHYMQLKKNKRKRKEKIETKRLTRKRKNTGTVEEAQIKSICVTL